MLKVKILESEKEKNELYSIRYKTFVEQEKTVPAEAYKSGLLKDGPNTGNQTMMIGKNPTRKFIMW